MSLLRFLLMSLILLSTTLWAGVGKVALLKGEATLERGVQKTALQNGTALEEKDIIKTSKDAQVQLMFEDKTVITLGSESEFKIEEYLNDNANPKAKFKFNQGAFKTITGQIGKTAPENFTLETKTATIGIRGTIVTGRTSANGDAIGCTSGLITVKMIGSQDFILVPAGKITFVAPGKEPTPPRDMKPGDVDGAMGEGANEQTGRSNDGNTQTQESTPTTTKAITKANDNKLFEKVRITADENNYNKIYKGFYTSIYSEMNFNQQPNERIFEYILTDSISYTNADYVFTAIVPLETLSRTITIPTNTYDEIITGTAFKKINPITIDDFTIKVNNSFITIAQAQQSIWYDYNYREIGISKITKGSFDDPMSPRYEEVVIAGSMSPVIPSSGLFFFDTIDGLFQDTSERLTGIANNEHSGKTAFVANLNNRKVLSLWLSEDSVSIGMGKILNNASITLSEYVTAYSLNTFNPTQFPTIDYVGSAELNGAFYGSHYQAVAFSGLSTGIVTDFDEVNYAYVQKNSFSTGIGLRNFSENHIPTDSYSHTQVLTGMMASQLLSDHSASFTNDLTITLNKNAGSVSVNSSDLTISHTESAYIHDDYFATLSTTTYDNIKLMKDYLMAISFDSENEDYVSWGYWGSHSIQMNTNPYLSTSTTPFSTWVAGVQTPTNVISSLISNATTYSYTGHVIGSAINQYGDVGYIRNNASNNAQFTFNFGSSSFVGNIAFQDSLNTTWNTALAGSLTTNGFSSTINDSGITGNLNGKFYGLGANSVAGSFNLVSSNADKAVGSFKTTRHITTP